MRPRADRNPRGWRGLIHDHGAMTDADGYELVDAGNGRRLERFGSRLVDRPAPGALGWPHAPYATWAAADFRFERDTGWSLPADPWTIEMDGLTLELRPTAAGQVGIFPEHRRFWPFLRDALTGAEGSAVLSLFAATGATTLALARAGASVTHVDASRPTVAWARRNAQLSGLAGAPIRWIVDDALAFTRREARRGRRFDAVILDPPSYGHGPGGRRWALADALPDLLDAVTDVLRDEAVVLLTAHTTGLEADDLGDALDDAFHGRGRIVTEPIQLVATSGAVLSSGVAARMILR
jgi:23S rRNA (cytosine1962-C5)-methyltransferase